MNKPIRDFYKGYSICQNSKAKWHRNPLSGHEWSEPILINTFSIHGPFTVHTMHSNFKSIESAKKEIDFIVKFGMNLPENNGC